MQTLHEIADNMIFQFAWPIVVLVGYRVLKRIVKKTPNKWDDEVLEDIANALRARDVDLGPEEKKK